MDGGDSVLTQTRPAYYNALRYADYCGLSSDDKSTIRANNGDRFYEIDTAIIYRYNKDSNEWIAQPDDTEAIDTGIPPMTSETAGYFLSNDGEVTHWQEFASADFIIHLTENNDDTYTSDKTWVQVKAALDSKENMAVSIGNGDSRLPLMVAQIADNGDATFTFGYTQVRVGGQIISSRCINYTHIDNVDVWVDGDIEADMSLYLPLDGGELYGALTLPGNPTNDNHAANKQYVDAGISKCVQLRAANSGQLKAYVQNGDKQDALIVTNSAYPLCLVRYTSGGQVDTNTPSSNNHAANKKYVDDAIANTKQYADNSVLNKLSTTGGAISGNLMIGGDLSVTGSMSVLESPVNGVDVANRGYVDSCLADVVRKNSVAVAGNSSVNVTLSNGVYLFATADNLHGGLVCVAVYDDGETITGLVNLNGWKCDRISSGKGVNLTNTASLDMAVYITSIGEGTYM